MENNNIISKLKENKKSIVIIAVVAVAALIGVKIFKNKKADNVALNILNPDNPIVIKKDKLYGYITSDGKEMIKPTYSSASKFYGEYAIVRENSGKDATDKVIDRKGNEKLKSEPSKSIKYNEEYGYWLVGDVLYSENFEQLTDESMKVNPKSYGYFTANDYTNNKYQVINAKGKIVYESKAEGIIIAEFDKNSKTEEVYARISTSKVDMIMNPENNKVVYKVNDATKDYIYTDDNCVYYIYNKENESESRKKIETIYVTNDKVDYKTTDDVEIDVLSKDYLKLEYKNASSKDKYKYYDLKNNKMLDEKPSIDNSSADSSEILYGAKKFNCGSSKYGIMKDDKILINCEYSDVEFLPLLLNQYIEATKGDSLALLEKDKKTSLVNYKNNKEVFKFNSSSVQKSTTSSFMYATDAETKEKVAYNLISGKSMKFSSSAKIELNSNYIIVSENNNKTYYNTKLKEIYKTNE